MEESACEKGSAAWGSVEISRGCEAHRCDQAERSMAGLRAYLMAYLLEALRLFVRVERWFDSEGSVDN